MCAFHLIPVVLAIACLASCARGGDKVATFTSLPKGDELRITFASSGCFHYFSYDLKFSYSPEPNLRVAWNHRILSADRKAFISTNLVSVGRLTLTKSDLNGLDRLISFYRSGPQRECTTVDTISISQIHAGKTMPTEQFTDGSCSDDRKGLTRITEVVRRLERPQ